jgi:transposase
VEALSQGHRQEGGAGHYVLDRFHILGHFGKAIGAGDQGPAGREPVSTKTRWLLLKRPEHLTEKQDVRLADLLRYNLCTVRSYRLKEDFQFFWRYRSPDWAGRLLDRWCTRTMRSKIGLALERRGRGFQRHSQTHYQKGLRFSDLSWARKSPCIMHLAPYPNQSSPTDSTEEAT